MSLESKVVDGLQPEMLMDGLQPEMCKGKISISISLYLYISMDVARMGRTGLIHFFPTLVLHGTYTERGDHAQPMGWASMPNPWVGRSCAPHGTYAP